MSKFLSTAVVASALLVSGIASAEEVNVASAAVAAFPVRSGVLLRSADGRRLGFVDKVENGRDGAPMFAQVIMEQRIVRVPVTTISSVDKSHFTTSMNYKDVTRR